MTKKGTEVIFQIIKEQIIYQMKCNFCKKRFEVVGLRKMKKEYLLHLQDYHKITKNKVKALGYV